MAQSLKQHYGLLLNLASPWEVKSVDLQMDQSRVVIEIQHRSKTVECSDCGKPHSRRDLAPPRRWRHLDTMNFETVIEAQIPRCNCPDCGVKTGTVPWAGKHSRFTLMFAAFAIEVLQMAKSLDAGRRLLGLSWDSAHAIMEQAVTRGLDRRDTSGVMQLGIDEKSFLKGHSYLTVLNDLEEGRVLDVVEGRTQDACKKLIETTLTTDWSRYQDRGRRHGYVASKKGSDNYSCYF